MKALIAVMGAEVHSQNGIQQASRETWAKDISLFADFRVFVGQGEMPLKEDEVRVDVPDIKDYILYKVVALLRWALERNYEHILKIDTDLFVNCTEMVRENYSGIDYVGSPVGKLGEYYAGTNCYGFLQGSATWLSAKAAKIVVDEVVRKMDSLLPDAQKYNGIICPYPHSEDLWIAQVLTPRILSGELRARADNRYAEGPLTFHFGYDKGMPYWMPKFEKWMKDLYAARGNNVLMKQIHEHRMDG